MSRISSVPNLTRDEAIARAEMLHVRSYDITIDLTDGSGNPAERSFRSTTTICFNSLRPGDSTFVDVVAESVVSVTLNDTAIDVSDYDPVRGIVLPGLAQDNEVTVIADMLFTNTGEGLHRFVDPVDGEVYLYSQFETADAKRVYACFDQPDLKAEFTFRVLAPTHWQLASNSRVEKTEPESTGRMTHFVITPRISTYITALIAGPYHVETHTHRGIDLGLWCRKSLAPHLDTDDLFLVTGQGFDWYVENFDVPYAFDKYDQIFAPEFNAGAMENAGCVTFHEDYIFRSKVTDARYQARAETILHEMAHMWFGDLVTMRWWDDLWLNESFATYGALLCQGDATRWHDSFTTFANTEKTWAYWQDQLPSTHPIASDAPDVQTAEVNFDGITYAKGASVLKQLGAYVGRTAFLTGIHEYFIEHAYGNTTLSDLLRALESSSGRDLGNWSKLWLETTGINTLRPDYSLGVDGAYSSFEIVQAAPNEVAHTNVLRPHRVAVGLYDDVDGTLVRSHRIELDINGERTAVPQLVGLKQPAVLLVNDDDLTYCKLRVDEHTFATLKAGGISRLVESLPRALCWSAAWDMTRDGELACRDYLTLVLAGVEDEADIGVMQSLIRQTLRALEIYADPHWAKHGYIALADKALAALRRSEPGSDQQLAWAHALLKAARTDLHLAEIRALFDGSSEVKGLAVDVELRWAIVQALSARGEIGAADIAEELEHDQSAAGQRHAATARALQPTQDAKAEAWRLAFEDDSLPNAMYEAVVAGFSYPTQGDLIAPYANRYFESIYDLWNNRTSELAQKIVKGLFPLWTSTISAQTMASADAFLARDDIPSPLRRLVIEGQADIVRAQRARVADSKRGDQ